MADETSHESDNGTRCQNFLGDLSDTLPVAAYSADVPEPVATLVSSGDDADIHSVLSPNNSIEVTVDVSSGVPHYSVAYHGTTYIDPSPIGFTFAQQEPFGTGISDTGPTVTVSGSETTTGIETWTPEWGSYDRVEAEYNAMTIGLSEATDPARSANLQVRVFDDGLGFRVVFDETFGDFVISSENTEFNFSEDYTAWWIVNEFVNPRFEQEYRETPLSEIPASSRWTGPNGNSVRTGAHTPLTMRASDGTYLSVHESNLDDYATMSLAATSDYGSEKMAVELAPLPDGDKVTATAPHTTPWRTVQVGDRPGDLIESELVPLLADERDDAVLPDDGDGGVDTSWISGRKYVGIWWLMIAGSAHWAYRNDLDIQAEGMDPAAYIHGARTERVKRYMQFASQHDIDSVLVEGWNEGWGTYPGDGTELEMGVADAAPDFDLSAVTSYGHGLSNPVEMTMHNETAGNVVNYENEIRHNDIFQDYEAAGIRSIKNGYVSDPGLGFEGDGSTATHNQHCQTAVNHHRFAIRAAAGNRQMLEIHEGVKSTGEIRTYPNVAAREVLKAQEFDGFDTLGSDVGRDHHVLLPFTRMLAGPISYQPGIFDITFNDNSADQIQTTRAKQLAMYPTYLGGLQMAADRIEAYIDSTLEVGEFVQAQAGALDGMITADRWRNCYGGHYVAVDTNREPEGATVSFTVKNVDTAGTYDLHLRYASDSVDNTPAVIDNGGPEATLVVNGAERTISPEYTAYWDIWSIHTVSIDLDAGDNTVTIKLGDDDVGGFNLNTVGISEAGADSPVPADYGDIDPGTENHDTVREFDFVEHVPTDWDETRVLDSEIGRYIVIARRSGDEWYLGAMTDDTSRDISVSFEFLASQPDGWVVTEYTDADGTDVDTDPTAVEINDFVVSSGDTLNISMAASGGTAMRLRPAHCS